MTPPRSQRLAAVHAATLLAAVTLLLYLGRHFWFHYDEWDIVGNHSLPLFQPHNEHWSTLPYLVYKALYPLLGLRHYLPYLAIVVVLHAGVAHLLWRVLRGEGVGGWIAVFLTAAFLVLGAGAENLVWAWQMGFVGSVFLGYGALLLAATGRTTGRTDMLAAAALVGALMCSGMGIVMLLVVALAIALRRGPIAALSVGALPLLCFAAWYLTFGHTASGQAYARPSLAGSLHFVWVGLTASSEMASGLKWTGPLLTVAAGSWAAWKLIGDRGGNAIAVAGVVGAVALFAIISAGRLQYGAQSAAQGRYVYVAAALLVPAAGLALNSLATRGRVGEVATALLLAWCFVHGARVLVLSERQHSAVTENTRRLVVAAADRLGAQPPADPAARPDPVAAPTLTMARIARFKRDGAMPRS
ncbi:MAG: hypothetical protein ABR598_05285 [Candidatus Dormibacteria bacterium]